ncbi:DUF4126 family protein [Mucilaginibacter pallidiroseus]|uniref:DUF4126 family protein n=1 Tax=Mucilaginibacter pallidiroseus TaxID=2599295 RepID=A0A563UIX9_9SPHI|nr:DUF4126 family protein [Mucilaginibacter pallidiroseus]TWR31315.1 DUF4126 family protein [Mucilaginibacter pallidiroseus]
MNNNTSSFLRAAGLGAVAGMRTFLAPAIISHFYSRHKSQNIEGSAVGFVQTIPTSKVFKVLAAGELIGDKMPMAPNRTEAPGLIGRIVTGVFTGATIYKADSKNALLGGLIGGTAAAAATFGCFFLRTTLNKKTALPNFVTGACEDALAITLGAKLISSNR